MSVEAYVLIQTEVGKSTQVAHAVREVEGVLAAEGMMGPYDVIARVEADSNDAINRLVVNRIQLIDGITRTLTCPVVHV